MAARYCSTIDSEAPVAPSASRNRAMSHTIPGSASPTRGSMSSTATASPSLPTRSSGSSARQMPLASASACVMRALSVVPSLSTGSARAPTRAV